MSPHEQRFVWVPEDGSLRTHALRQGDIRLSAFVQRKWPKSELCCLLSGAFVWHTCAIVCSPYPCPDHAQSIQSRSRAPGEPEPKPEPWTHSNSGTCALLEAFKIKHTTPALTMEQMGLGGAYCILHFFVTAIGNWPATRGTTQFPHLPVWAVSLLDLSIRTRTLLVLHEYLWRYRAACRLVAKKRAKGASSITSVARHSVARVRVGIWIQVCSGGHQQVFICGHLMAARRINDDGNIYDTPLPVRIMNGPCHRPPNPNPIPSPSCRR